MSFTLFGRGNDCPICGSHDERCKTNDNALIFCMGIDETAVVSGYRSKGRTKNGVWSLWVVDDASQGNDQARRDELQRKREQRQRDEAQRRAESVPVAQRDRWYRRLFAELDLHADDRADLEQRGFTSEQILKAGFKSVRSWQQLQEEYPSNLPGVSIDGRSLNVGADGYLQPLRDVKGRITGFQLRLRQTTTGKHRWLTSATKKRPNGATPHLPNGELPLAVFRPKTINNRAIALVEGTGAKPFLLSERHQLVTIGAAGGQFASSPETLKSYLDTLLDELGTRRVEFYPDAGSPQNNHVVSQYGATWDLLEQWGFEVAIAWWGQLTKADGDIDEISGDRQIAFITRADFEAFVTEELGTTPAIDGWDAADEARENWVKRAAQAARSRWLKSKRYTSTVEEIQQYLNVPSEELFMADIHAVKSGMGTGKTQEIARILKDWKGGAIAIGSRNSLLLQSCERWGEFYHLHNDNAFALTADPNARIATCIDSLQHFKPSDFDGKTIILDEVTSIVKHALTSSTLKGRREPCLEMFTQAIKRAAVVLAWDGNCCDIAINYLAALRGENCRVVKRLNPYQGDRLNVELIRSVNIENGAVRFRDHSPATRKLNETMEAFRALPSGTAKGVTVVSDSQRFLEALDRNFQSKGYKTLRLDSKTSATPGGKEFQLTPNEVIERDRPDVILLSPTAESGLDISIKGYFKRGFAFFFGVVDTDTQRQFLRRVRDCLDWTAWVTEYSRPDDGSGSRSAFPAQIRNQLLAYIEMDAIAAVEGTDRESTAQQWLTNLQQQLEFPHVKTWLEFQAARNFERSHTRECLQWSLENDGHNVTLIDLDRCKEYQDTMKALKSEITAADALAIFNSPDITLDEAAQIKASFTASTDDRWAAEKAFLKSRLPGIERTGHWSANLIEKLLFTDRGLLKRLERYLWLDMEDEAKRLSEAHWGAIIESNRGYLPDMVSDFSRVRALRHLNIKGLCDGNDHSAESPAVQAIYQKLKRSTRLQTALGFNPGRLTPMDCIGRLMRMVGINSTEARRTTGDRERVYRYALPETDLTYRTLLECLKNKLISKTAGKLEQQELESVHLPPKDESLTGQGGQNQSQTGQGDQPILEPALDEWLNPDSIADIRQAIELADGDAETLEYLRPYIPTEVWEAIAA